MNSLEQFQELFNAQKAFIGMVHLRSTVGYDDHPGMDEFVRHAVADAVALEKGGAHGICIENDRDQPHTILITDEQEACILEATKAIKEAVSIPVGVGVLLNDWKAALDITNNANAEFVRVDVFVDRVSCDAGVIEPEAEKIMEYRDELNSDIAVYTDIQVKHKVLLEEGKPLEQSAEQAIQAGSDAVIVTGNATGEETPIESVKKVKHTFTDFPVLIGAGVDAKNVVEQFTTADGAFIGSSLKNDNDEIDVEKVRELSNSIASL